MVSVSSVYSLQVCNPCVCFRYSIHVDVDVDVCGREKQPPDRTGPPASSPACAWPPRQLVASLQSTPPNATHNEEIAEQSRAGAESGSSGSPPTSTAHTLTRSLWVRSLASLNLRRQQPVQRDDQFIHRLQRLAVATAAAAAASGGLAQA